MKIFLMVVVLVTDNISNPESDITAKWLDLVKVSVVNLVIIALNDSLSEIWFKPLAHKQVWGCFVNLIH